MCSINVTCHKNGLHTDLPSCGEEEEGEGEGNDGQNGPVPSGETFHVQNALDLGISRAEGRESDTV